MSTQQANTFERFTTSLKLGMVGPTIIITKFANFAVSQEKQCNCCSHEGPTPIYLGQVVDHLLASSTSNQGVPWVYNYGVYVPYIGTIDSNSRIYPPRSCEVNGTFWCARSKLTDTGLSIPIRWACAYTRLPSKPVSMVSIEGLFPDNAIAASIWTPTPRYPTSSDNQINQQKFEI